MGYLFNDEGRIIATAKTNVDTYEPRGAISPSGDYYIIDSDYDYINFGETFIRAAKYPLYRDESLDSKVREFLQNRSLTDAEKKELGID